MCESHYSGWWVYMSQPSLEIESTNTTCVLYPSSYSMNKWVSSEGFRATGECILFSVVSTPSYPATTALFGFYTCHLSTWWERFCETQKVDDRGPLSIQSSLLSRLYFHKCRRLFVLITEEWCRIMNVEKDRERFILINQHLIIRTYSTRKVHILLGR